MCSGCAGDYENDGGFDEPPERTLARERYEETASPQLGRGSAETRKQGESRGWPTVDDYDVFVTGDHIFEIRTICSIPHVYNQISAEKEPTDWVRRKGQSDHSLHRSAKHYATALHARIGTFAGFIGGARRLNFKHLASFCRRLTIFARVGGTDSGRD